MSVLEAIAIKGRAAPGVGVRVTPSVVPLLSVVSAPRIAELGRLSSVSPARSAYPVVSVLRTRPTTSFLDDEVVVLARCNPRARTATTRRARGS